MGHTERQTTLTFDVLFRNDKLHHRNIFKIAFNLNDNESTKSVTAQKLKNQQISNQGVVMIHVECCVWLSLRHLPSLN